MHGRSICEYNIQSKFFWIPSTEININFFEQITKYPLSDQCSPRVTIKSGEVTCVNIKNKNLWPPQTQTKNLRTEEKKMNGGW